MKRWRDLRENTHFILEDLVVYTAVIGCDIFYDPLLNVFYGLGLMPYEHPVSLGYGQLFILLAFVLLWVRKFSQLKVYWTDIFPYERTQNKKTQKRVREGLHETEYHSNGQDVEIF